MDRRKTCDRRPQLELIETRVLLSDITDVLAANSIAHQSSVLAKQTATLNTFEQQQSFPVSAAVAGGPVGNLGSNYAPFTPSRTSIANPVTNQGQQGSNFALQPVGTLTPAALKSELFTAYFQGTYSVSPGLTNLEKSVTLIKAAGNGTSFLHGDIQFRIVTPNTPTFVDSQGITETTQIGGVAAIFDRNLNSNTVLGLDTEAPDSDVDAGGRPNHFSTVTIDVNASSGLYDEAYSQGTIDIRYTPSRHHAKGLIQQGFAVVKIQAQIYAPDVDFILANANIDPGGPSA
jgi:hypothetical protein